MKNKYEILAPVGNWDMFYAAVASGADAVYMAGHKFGARAYANNFSIEDIRDLVSYAHLRNVKVYITVNTLIKDEELEQIYQYILELVEAKVDALIIQDFGVYNIIRKSLPELELHASTQMAINSLQSAKYIEDLGFERVVVGREVDLEEIDKINKKTGLEIEAFMHGSLCVSVSGQCLISSLIGQRSGNRGRCAQPCRKLYHIKNKDGKVISKYSDSFLSARDLNMIDDIKRLQEIGVFSYKIEGRMKKKEYVYTVVNEYKKALEGRTYDRDRLASVSNRKFTKGLPLGDFSKDYYNPKNSISGEQVGQIKKDSRKIFFIASKDLVKEDIVSVENIKGRRFNLTLTQDMKKNEGWDLTNYKDLRDQSLVYRIHSKSLVDDLDESLKRAFKKPINLYLSLRKGSRPYAKVSLEGKDLELEGDFIIEESLKMPLKREKIEEQMDRMGTTIYELARLEVDMDEDIFIPVSFLNSFRRSITDLLDEEVLKRKAYNPGPYPDLREEKKARQKKLSYEYMEAFSKDIDFSKIERVYTHNLESIKVLKAFYQGPVYFVGPRIMTEKDYEDLAISLEDKKDLIDGFSANSLGDVHFYKTYNKPIHLESYLNIFNSQAIDFFLEEGLDDFSLSQELNVKEIDKLIKRDSKLEIIGYGQIPQMILKHCPASILKGCVDDSKCDTCPYAKDISLENEFDSLPVYRHYGYSEVVTDRALNILAIEDQIRRLDLDYIRLVDRDDKDMKDMVDKFYESFILGNKTYIDSNKYILGHYDRGVI